VAKFNKPAVGTKTVNLAGGNAYKQTDELALVSHLLTSFVDDQYYRSQGQGLNDLASLIGGQKDKKFAAQAMVFARQEFGMRSVTHAGAAILAPLISGQPWAKGFYSAVVRRPDDITEILSVYLNGQNRGKGSAPTLPHSMQKGLAAAFAKFNGYQLAKYRGEGKGIKLVDAVNILHPKPSEKNAGALKDLIAGKLVSTDTWEMELTQAGQKATSDEEKAEFKKDVWVKLIRERKLGYFALLRNLRNIIEQAPEIVTEAVAMLTDEALIKKSLVLPFRFQTAHDELTLVGGRLSREVLVGIGKALDISCANVPKYDGDTLVVLDDSGSMNGKPFAIGSLFAAVLAKSNNADIIMFGSLARWVNYNPNDTTITIADGLRKNMLGGGTDFTAPFRLLMERQPTPKFARMIWLSDMQGWMRGGAPTQDFASYQVKSGCNPNIFSFDLAGHGTMQFPEARVYCVAGFSEKVLDVMRLLEGDRQALVNRIKKVEL